MSDFVLGHSDIGYLSTSWSGGTWASGLGTGMLNRQLLTAVARTTTTTDLTLDFNLGANVDPEVVGLLNHNLTSVGTVTWEAYSTSAARTTGTSPNFTSGALTVGSYDPSLTYQTMVTDCGAPQAYAYWRVKISDSGNPDGFFEIGRIFLGKRFYPERNFDYGLQMGVIESNSDLTTSPIGVETFIDAPNKRTARFSFNLVDYSEGNDFYKFMLANGIVGTCVFEFNPDDFQQGIYTFACRQSALNPLDFPSYNINSFSINLVEII